MDIKILFKKTKASIIDVCKKKRLLGDLSVFKSDKTPTKKIKNTWIWSINEK